MAGDKLYLGNILGQLKQDVNDYTQILQTVVTELRSVKEAVSSNISFVNVKASDNLRVAVAHGQKSITTKVSRADCDVMTGHCLARGIIRIRFDLHFVHGSALTGLYVRVGEFYTRKEDCKPGTYTFDVPIGAGDTFVIGMKPDTIGLVYSISANSLKIYYDLVDIVNTPAVQIVEF